MLSEYNVPDKGPINPQGSTLVEIPWTPAADTYGVYTVTASFGSEALEDFSDNSITVYIDVAMAPQIREISGDEFPISALLALLFVIPGMLYFLGKKKGH